MSDKAQILPAQIRAARALLGWSVRDLAEKVEVSEMTLADFEAVRRAPDDRLLARIRRILEAGGVAFIDQDGEGPGVRLCRNVGRGASIETIPLEELNAENDE